MSKPVFIIAPESASFSQLDDAPIRQDVAQELQRREAALLEAVLVRLCDRRRLLPGDEIWWELWGTGEVVWTMPEPIDMRVPGGAAVASGPSLIDDLGCEP
jgi:hypothetical protein